MIPRDTDRSGTYRLLPDHGIYTRIESGENVRYTPGRLVHLSDDEARRDGERFEVVALDTDASAPEPVSPAPTASIAPAQADALAPVPAFDWSSLLDQSALDVIETLADLDADTLRSVRAAEAEGRARKGVLRAIDAKLTKLGG